MAVTRSLHWTAERARPMVVREDVMGSPSLEVSRDRILKTGVRGPAILTQAIGARMVAGWALAPAPADPVPHVEAAHAHARRDLAGLLAHDPAREVGSVMTEELFTRMTDPRPAPLAAPANTPLHVYAAQDASMLPWCAWRRCPPAGG